MHVLGTTGRSALARGSGLHRPWSIWQHGSGSTDRSEAVGGHGRHEIRPTAISESSLPPGLPPPGALSGFSWLSYAPYPIDIPRTYRRARKMPKDATETYRESERRSAMSGMLVRGKPCGKCSGCATAAACSP